jgi:hypothetical protein
MNSVLRPFSRHAEFYRLAPSSKLFSKIKQTSLSHRASV